MAELQFVKDYKEDKQLRASFFELAENIFGLKFKDWHEKGFWGNQYIPFSFADGDKIVANVSVNTIDLLIYGKKYSAIQIGTVMTHPDYRNRGLAAKLMNVVLEEFKGYDFMYLFANDSVLDFYPKFGFKEADEYQFSMDFSLEKKNTENIRKLDITNNEELRFVYEYIKERIPVSQIFAAENAQDITMYHCLNVLYSDIYYIESDDVIVIFKKKERQLDIFDIISKREINIERILTKIADENIDKVIFRYTPDYDGIKFDKKLIERDGALFIKSKGGHSFPKYFKHPMTAEA